MTSTQLLIYKVHSTDAQMEYQDDTHEHRMDFIAVFPSLGISSYQNRYIAESPNESKPQDMEFPHVMSMRIFSIGERINWGGCLS